jgi:hypothetical protein
MEGKLPYLGKEWREEAERRLVAELTPERMNGITTSMANLYSNCPGGADRWLFVRCEDGRVAEFLTGEGSAPEAEFRILGDYETFAAISRAELGSQRALMTGKLRLKGNMAKALRLAPLADRINKVLSTIPTSY